MPRTFKSFALALFAAFALWPSADAEAIGGSLQGTWDVRATPQEAPGFPIPPPAFNAVFAFHLGGTVTQTDPTTPPGAPSPIFLPDLGPFNTGDGLGVWKRKGRRTYAYTVIKPLFVEGLQVGFLRIRGEARLSADRRRFEGPSLSDFILGDDLETGDLFFTGPVNVEGRRVRIVPLDE